MEESLNNLRAMAASVGCRVEVQRVIAVGECEWVEHTGPLQHRTKKSRLLVAEAFIRPDQHFDQHRVSLKSEKMVDSSREASLSIVTGDETKKNVQLRISLTGATTSGKSSLLGTLSTGTLDDGRGKSRLNLLRHRHEIESGGITSSITQELIGYHDIVDIEGKTSTQVINYGSTDHSSWTAIHTSVSSSTSGRLLFLTDSAGHPRFLRTTVRGLVGWDPHYTLLCIPANNAQGSSEKIGTSPSAKGVQGAAGDLDLSMEHLHLCLALELPLLVVITKFDLATKAGLTSVILKIRTALHDAGRKTCIIANRSTSTSETGLDTIPLADLEEANQAVEPLKVSSASVVPIILTSALSGVGLSKLHAFLRKLPVPSPPTPPSNTPSTVFYLEDMYTKGPTQSKRSNEPTIVGGHLRYGTLSIGEELLLGPYPAETSPEDSDSGSGKISRQHPAIPVSRSFPGALNQKSTNSTQSSARSTSASLTEWRRVHIVSLRNLRQPVRTLHAGQVGTIGMSPVRGQASILSPAINRIRKGMILTNDKPSASRTLFVRFIGSSAQAANTLSIGSAVVIYAASVRASSKVMSISQEGGNGAKEQTTTDAEKEQEEEEEEGFGFGLDLDEDAASEFSDGDISGVAATVVTFQFIASREFVEANAKVLVMPGGGPGLTGTMERGEKGMAGLESFVGRVVDGRS
jgi:GTPase